MPIIRLEESIIEEKVPELSDVRYVGKGGQKLVYSVIYKDELRALKIYPVASNNGDEGSLEDTLEDRAEIARLIREIETQKIVNIPEMVRIVDFPVTVFEHLGTDYYAYLEEFIEGEDLQTLILNGYEATPSDIVRLPISICRAIKELWATEKIHRDIKPSNIMMTNYVDRRFILLDMGTVFDLLDSSITVYDIPIGTWRYMSPEQLIPKNRRELLDFRSDLYSLGITIYEFATRRHPYWVNTDNLDTIKWKIKNAYPLPLKIIRNDLPEEFYAVFDRLIKKPPQVRPNSIEGLIAELEVLGDRL